MRILFSKAADQNMFKIKTRLRAGFDRFFCGGGPYLQLIGSVFPWMVMPRLIPTGGTVISGGVGQGIDFEKELAARFNCTIHLFDPTPTGKKTMGLPANIVPGIFYYEVGLAGHPGSFEFAYPRDANEGSFGVVGADSRPRIRLECDSVINFMKSKGIGHCDLLKLDIEGFEYEVIDELLAAKVVIPQICIEYHHFLPGIPLWRSFKQIRKLLRANYRIAYKHKCEYLFVHKSCWPAA